MNKSKSDDVKFTQRLKPSLNEKVNKETEKSAFSSKNAWIADACEKKANDISNKELLKAILKAINKE